ncbi:MAG: aldehyde ferredoxin oxidoreductase N-terminal domain-containing protein [Dehalococcoidia bacterium]|nr:aldehyde ferredoxin oxidoreductase N-terminal domain-containing protein [Dehalococcoidia bacterium]
MSALHGYAGRVLRVDLSSGQWSTSPTSDYVLFVGGRGFAAKVHWEEVPPEVGALDPANRLTFFTGPMAGFAGFGSSRWLVCGKSPATNPEHFCHSNLGGTWGVALKSAGYDGVVIHGRADRPVYLLVTHAGVQVRDAAHLWGKGAIQARETLKSELGASVNVVACGQAGENLVITASIIADKDASGSSGFGAVMGSKRLKAVAVVKGDQSPAAADPDRLRELVRHYAYLQGNRDASYFTVPGKTRRDSCWGCPGLCGRIAWRAADGTEGKYFCQSALMYQIRAAQFYGQGKEGDVPFRVTKLCDNYGIDTMAIHVIMSWLSRCHREGLLTEEETGVPLSKAGSFEFAEALVRRIALREGFGDLLARGVEKAADAIGRGTREKIGDLLHKAQQVDQYGGRTYIVNSLLYATEVRMPIQHLHKTSIPVMQWLGWVQGLEGAYVSGKVFRDMAVRFYGSEAAADFSSYEGKALAAKTVQDRQYAAECLVLCDYAWPVMVSPVTDDHVGDPSLESRFYSAVTGQQVDEAGLSRIGERVFNLQRSILAREGWQGQHSDTLPEYNFTTPLKFDVLNPQMLVPGPDGNPVSRKGLTLDRAEFERMKKQYYQLRGWDPVTGRQTRRKLEELGLADVAADLESRDLLA